MSFFLIVWNMKIYMHDIVNVELLVQGLIYYAQGQILVPRAELLKVFPRKTLIHIKKAYPRKRIGPPCFVYPLNNACAAFQIMAIAKMRTITIPTTSRNVSRPEKIVFATGSLMKAKPVNMAIKYKM